MSMERRWYLNRGSVYRAQAHIFFDESKYLTPPPLKRPAPDTASNSPIPGCSKILSLDVMQEENSDFSKRLVIQGPAATCFGRVRLYLTLPQVEVLMGMLPAVRRCMAGECDGPRFVHLGNELNMSTDSESKAITLNQYFLPTDGRNGTRTYIPSKWFIRISDDEAKAIAATAERVRLLLTKQSGDGENERYMDMNEMTSDIDDALAEALAGRMIKELFSETCKGCKKGLLPIKDHSEKMLGCAYGYKRKDVEHRLTEEWMSLATACVVDAAGVMCSMSWANKLGSCGQAIDGPYIITAIQNTVDSRDPLSVTVREKILSNYKH